MAAELQTLVQTDEPPIVFVSYSHKDEAWVEKLLPHLEALGRLGTFEVWNDRDIKAGVDWYAEIKEKLSKTKVAICLISANFLRSPFCMDEEVAYLLQRRNKGDLEIISILLEDCTWEAHRWLSRLQRFPRDDETVKTNYRANPARVFKMVSDQVHEMMQPGNVFRRPKPAGDPPEKVDITRLPESDDILFGRQDELNFLDKVWKDNTLNLAVFKASGGVGKTSLVRCWVEDMALDNYRGARRIYAWSFYSQGTNERVTSADLFLAEALEWFGDKTRGEGLSAWDRGQRLADLIRQQRTLLLLDGLEPLQSGQAFDRGKIKDPGLEVLLFELAKNNSGLCLITTREEVTDLWYEEDNVSVEPYDLDKISTTAGRALLRVRGIQGDDDELEQAVRDFGQHAYAIKLLGSFLAYDGKPHIKHSAKIPDLPNVDEKDGKHPRRVMAAFADRFGQSPKANILAMLGLFDRPADEGCIKALRASPAVAGLNHAVQGLDENEWTAQIEELRLLSLLTPKSHHAENELDAHPLVREHFGAGLRARREEAWKAGHLRLYEHLRRKPNEVWPDTFPDMLPLFDAVHHGCAAGRYLDTIGETYFGQIRRDQNFHHKRFGSYSTDLATISNFFDSLWDTPKSELDKRFQQIILNQAGLCLKALGRLSEASSPMLAAYRSAVNELNNEQAARGAINMAELFVSLGNLKEALKFCRHSVDYARISDDQFAKIVSLTSRADALHQSGRNPEAEDYFRQAEKIQEQYTPETPYLYSI